MFFKDLIYVLKLVILDHIYDHLFTIATNLSICMTVSSLYLPWGLGLASKSVYHRNFFNVTKNESATTAPNLNIYNFFGFSFGISVGVI